MKVWFTTQELADASAQGVFRDLPTTKMGISKLAEREGWDRHSALVRRRPGREGGGGFEYHIEQLPLSVRLGYIARHFSIDAANIAPDLGLDDGLSARGRQTRDAKIAILRMADAFRRSTQLTTHAADGYFASLFNAGSIDVPAWVKDAVATLSGRSIARYRGAAREDANTLGHDPALARKGTGLLDSAHGGEVRSFILALIALQPHLAAREVRKQCRAEFGDTIVDRSGELRPMPPERTFQHFLRTLKASNEVLLTKLTDPDRFRSHYALSGVGALRHITEPNQLWQIDASPVDALCVDGRYSIYVCIDIATRRIVVTLSRTPRASAVALLIRKAILLLGVPDMIKTDNGSDFVAKETQRLLQSLGIDTETSDAYSPEQKGHVERVIKTLQHQIGPLLPGYVGHNVADRKAIEGRKSFAQRLGETEAETFGVSLTAAELQRKIDEWVELTYSHAPHSGVGMAGRSPAVVAATSTRPARTVNERALDVLLMPVAGSNGMRVMTKRGIRIDGHHYMTGDVLPGTPVFVRLDPLDAGRTYVFAQDGAEFLTVAICAELAGVKPESLIKAAKERQAEIVADALRPVRATLRRLAKGPALIDRALEVDRRDAAARAAEGANVIQLPRRQETHSTPQIDAAIAATSERPIPTRQLNEREAAEHRRLISEMAAEDARELLARTDAMIERRQAQIEAERRLPAGVATLPESPKQRYARAYTIQQAAEAGQAVDPADAIWCGRYQESAEFKAHARLHAEYGDAYLS